MSILVTDGSADGVYKQPLPGRLTGRARVYGAYSRLGLYGFFPHLFISLISSSAARYRPQSR